MTRTHLVAPTLLAALLALTAGAARAESWSFHSGAGCTSDGSTLRPTNGSLLNITPQFSGYSTFSCPVPRYEPPTGAASNTYIYVNFKVSDGPASFYCVLRSVNDSGDIVDSDSLTVPKGWQVSNVKDHWGGPLTVSGPTNGLAYATILRCQVPNYPATPGGIISYHVRH